MTLYAHVTGSTVDAVGQPPQLIFEAGRWWDLRPLTAAVLNPRGWFAVTEVARPADTATTTHDYAVTLVAGVPTQVWTARPKTPDELATDTAATNEADLRAKATNALAVNATFLAVASPTNAQTLAQVKALTRQVNALIKLEVRALSDTTGT